MQRSGVKRRSLLVSAAVILASGSAAPCLRAQAQPQASEKPPAFDVVSIKPVEMPAGTFVFSMPSTTLRGISGNRFTRRMIGVADLITAAYGIQSYQLDGLPQWASGSSANRYDIVASTGSDEPVTPAQARLMLQSMLAERFQLKIHRDERELPVYELVLAKSGPKLKEVPADAKPLPSKGNGTTSFKSSPAAASLMRTSMLVLTNLLGVYLDRPVIDKTGLTAPQYEFTWDATAVLEDLRSGGKPAASVFSAVQEQLGLKLEPRKSPFEVLVIDRLEKPSAN